MQPIRGNTWESNHSALEKEESIPDNKRIGDFIEKILKEPVEEAQDRVIVLPSKGKAHLTNLKVMGALSDNLCRLLRNSESAIKAYMVEHKVYLQKKGEWGPYLKTLEGFAKEKGGILASYLQRELDKEKMIELLKGEMTEEIKHTFCELLKSAFSSSEPLELSDLYLLDQIPRLNLMKEEPLNGQWPVSVEKIRETIERLANPLSAFDSFFQNLFKGLNETSSFDSSFPSLFKDLMIYLMDSDAKGDKKEAVNRMIKAFIKDDHRLDLSHLNLTKIPSLIGRLTHLEELYLTGNQLQSLPKEIGDLTHLKTFYLSNNQLQSLPKEIGKLIHLKTFYLSENQLQSLPKEIGELNSLKDLCLSKNKLQSLPKEIEALTYLEKFTVSFNQLESIPNEIERLTHLKKLHLNNNRLKSIPNSIGALSGLDALDFSSNKLESIPNSIGNLVSLQMLYLNDNNLESIPSSIGNLLNLTYLSIQDNKKLTDCPMSLGNIAGLNEFDIEGTQISKSHLKAILEKSEGVRLGGLSGAPDFMV